ncbi:Dos2-interacting transcription regulator of RNA-Pol-II-domain-containing protein [Microdochium trichocladiopsis]|uniref:MMS19 nucleotide excision repair protein n=1 Tax=Microdochium trichocladiopsis TaxID=1682393 RepID=A0A9P9BN17_9PEZI|nr:Dos2-interacting transcription regulator of RNA-Pol-II-domain-containing protein [Microdochium trichocladiopsis]KAH7026486.1 Dos2-interacting transcription regulator of RNA-Pol-II-domain-containing protein [Microdochium trichocladiopsis]
MAGSRFDELALQYVLAVDKSAEATAASDAASLIQSSTNNRILVGQWVSSINRWISPAAGSGDRMDDGTGLDQDLISRAKALDFLASTLEVLSRDTLRADQVKLLATFFGSLFSSDHRAGVAASAKALRQLTQMKAFHPALASDIILSVSKLGDDFKLQTPTTRLELFELFNGFFTDETVVGDLTTRHGEGSGFMTGLLDLCRSERDPKNLMIWFSILKTFIQSFSPSTEMLEATFKAFSAYFPISLRASTTPSGITADDLKRAVRACFSANHRLASLTIPFLLGKLDQGDAVTVAVKVDILQTLEACLAQYTQPQQSVVPYVDSIWSSLKYEVRNGEVADIVEATLKTIAALTRRLDGNDLSSFFATAWQDLSDDLTNPTYATQAGRLLVSISGASMASFDLAVSQSMSLLQSTLRDPKSSSHQQDLLTVVNSLLLVRTHLEYPESSRTSSSTDDVFGDSLFSGVYQRLWEENLSSDAQINEKNALFKKLMDGMASLVAQRTSSDPTKRLCTDSTCILILEYLSRPAIVCPLTDVPFFQADSSDPMQDALQESAAAALTKAVPQFPEGFQQVLLIFLTTVESTLATGEAPPKLAPDIQIAASTLSDIVCSESASDSIILTTARACTYTLLQGLSTALKDSKQPGPVKQELVSAFISSIHLNVTKSLQVLAKTGIAQPQKQTITREWFSQFETAMAALVSSPDLRAPNSLQWPESLVEPASTYTQLLAFYLVVVRQLYLSFTRIEQQTNDDGSGRLLVGLAPETQSYTAKNQDMYLHHLGLLACTVVRDLSQDEQIALSLDEKAFTLFHDVPATDAGTMTFSPLNEFRTVPLAMGILQGLYPGAINEQRHNAALENLFRHLTQPLTKMTLTTRGAMDNTFALLSNKYQPKGQERSAERLRLQRAILRSYHDIIASEVDVYGDPWWQVRAFCSILHYLAGDTARFQGNPAENELLQVVCKEAIRNELYGHYLAPYFALLVSPKQCLAAENHAVRKRLSEQWIYHQAVQPYYPECFPAREVVEKDPRVEDIGIARSVSILCILQHLQYEHYAADAVQVVRILVSKMPTLTHDGIAAALGVLLTILEKDPSVLKEHLGGLVKNATLLQARYFKEAQSLGRHGKRDPKRDNCRRLNLLILCKLPATFEASLCLPHRQQLLRPLSHACGDPVREIRRLALAARQVWEALN